MNPTPPRPESDSDDTSLNIIFLGSNMTSMSGVVRWTFTMANTFQEKGHRVQLVGVKNTVQKNSFPLNSRIEVMTLTNAVSATGKLLRLKVWLARLINSITPTRLHQSTIQDLPPEGKAKLDELLLSLPKNSVIICTGAEPMYFLHMSAKRTGKQVPAIGQYHSTFSTIKSTTNLTRILLSMESFRMFVALTEADFLEFQSSGVNPSTFINNPAPDVQPSEYARVGKKQFVMIGRLSPEKAPDQAIRAWKSVIDKHPGWQLKIFGEGPLLPSLQKLVTKLDLENHVVFGGVTESPLTELQESYGLIVTSEYEGWPLAVVEASAVGTPTISYNCSHGMRELIDSGRSGFLVQPGDLDDLAAQITWLIDHPERRDDFGLAAQENIANYSLESITQQWKQLMRKISEPDFQAGEHQCNI